MAFRAVVPVQSRAKAARLDAHDSVRTGSNQESLPNTWTPTTYSFSSSPRPSSCSVTMNWRNRFQTIDLLERGASQYAIELKA